VLLDEPTAGMDLSARRGLWEMLKNSRKDKIIILTTHYMDEADVLGDRIGIMAAGNIICLGSSLFLKNRYGTGFKLTLVKATKEPNDKIGPYIQKRLGNCEKLSEVASEITFKIPADLLDQFQNFFNEFDGNLEELGILSYGINMTSLEEVFLKSNETTKSPEIQAAIEAKVDDEDAKGPGN
jgi:ATP-binding cassette subfamily A (ABC1) protein 3